MTAQSEARGVDGGDRPIHPLRVVRASRGLSQSELAELISISRSTVSRIENYVERPLDSTASRLADALGWEPSDLFPQDDNGRDGPR